VSAQNVELIRKGYEAFSERGEEAIFEFLDPEIEVRPIDEPPVGLRSYRGHEGFRQYLADTREVWGSFGWEATELTDAGDSVVARTRFYAEGRGSGVPVEAIVYIVWRVRDGKRSAPAAISIAARRWRRPRPRRPAPAAPQPPG
jgi:ketosteroid isomerase-like protein